MWEEAVRWEGMRAVGLFSYGHSCEGVKADDYK